MLSPRHLDNDASWLDDLRAGKLTCADDILNLHFAQMVRIARFQLKPWRGSRAVLDSEIVASSAFRVFYQAILDGRLTRIQNEEGVKRVLFMLTRKKAIDYLRRETAHGGRYEHFTFDDDAHAVFDYDPAETAALRDNWDRLLKSLGDPQLELIAQLDLEGHTNQEIANLMKCSAMTVARKLRVIRTCWKELLHDDQRRDAFF